ncbi:MAG: hypothetical protein ACI8VT_001083, partial [Saprospiraceae bacterium]
QFRLMLLIRINAIPKFAQMRISLIFGLEWIIHCNQNATKSIRRFSLI